MKSARLWVVILLMTGTALVLRARGNVDRVPPSAPLANLPQAIGSWTGRDLSIDPAVLEVLGKGSFLNRVYIPDPAGAPQPPVMLFIAYFPTQRTGQAIHSPQNCLPGSGWTFVSSGVTDLADKAGKRYQVGEYVISDGKSKQEVLYWYRSHGRSIANDYKAKLYTLADSIRLNRTDAALIRVVTPLAGPHGAASPNQNEAQREAHLRAVAFAEQVVPLLPPYIPD